MDPDGEPISALTGNLGSSPWHPIGSGRIPRSSSFCLPPGRFGWKSAEDCNSRGQFPTRSRVHADPAHAAQLHARPAFLPCDHRFPGSASGRFVVPPGHPHARFARAPCSRQQPGRQVPIGTLHAVESFREQLDSTPAASAVGGLVMARMGSERKSGARGRSQCPPRSQQPGPLGGAS